MTKCLNLGFIPFSHRGRACTHVQSSADGERRDSAFAPSRLNTTVMVINTRIHHLHIAWIRPWFTSFRKFKSPTGSSFSPIIPTLSFSVMSQLLSAQKDPGEGRWGRGGGGSGGEAWGGESDRRSASTTWPGRRTESPFFVREVMRRKSRRAFESYFSDECACVRAVQPQWPVRCGEQSSCRHTRGKRCRAHAHMRKSYRLRVGAHKLP